MTKKLLVIFMISITFLSGCNKKETVIPTLVEPVGGDMDTAVVSRGDIYDLTTYDAKIYPDIQEVYFSVDGKVKDIAVYLGQEVEKGDLLASLNDKAGKEELAKLEEDLKETKNNNIYNNMQQDLDIKILELNIKKKIAEKASEIDVAQMNADLEKLVLIKQQTLVLQGLDIEKKQEKIDEIKIKLEKNRIVAPCSGSVVYIKDVNLNERVNANDTFVIVTDDSKLHVQSEFIEERVIKAASQLYAIIKGKEYEIEYIPLKTDEIIKMKNSGAVIESKYSIKVDNNIASGDYACICIKEKLKTNVVTIPKNALYSDSEGYFVYCMTDGNLERYSVEIGTQTNTQVEIINGLAEGDVVYVQG